MKSLLTVLLLVLGAQSAQAEYLDACLVTIEKAAVHAAAYQAQVDVKDVFVVRSELGAWTEAVGSNSGSGTASVMIGKDVSYFLVHAKQIGRTDQCNVTKIEQAEIDAMDPLALQAEKYRIAIGNALHISEGDAQWTAFYRHSNATGFTKAQLSKALGATSHLEIYSFEHTVRFLTDYAEDNDYADDKQKYAKLLKVLKKDFKDFRLIKVGQPDSGGLDLYLLGITPDGKLVGLRTITVET